MLNTATVILKITERCNINCKYCYFFNNDNNEYLNHSPIIKKETIRNIAKFLNDSIADLNLNKIVISLHGGEPLMMGKSKFKAMMDEFNNIQNSDKLEFCVQTNATLIDKEWADILSEYNISIGVSIDGPKFINDINRIDKKGRGTYERIITGVNILKERCGIDNISAICVGNTDYSPKYLFNHLTNDIGLTHFDVLLEDYDHDDQHIRNSTKNTNYMLGLLDCWMNTKTKPKITCINNMFTSLAADSKEGLLYGKGNSIVVTIDVDGKLCPSDEVMNCNIEWFKNAKHVCDITLREFLEKDEIYNFNTKQLNQDCQDCNVKFNCKYYLMGTLPEQCQECELKFVCQGQGIGNIGNRYSKKNEFNNPTVFCSTVQELYKRGISILVNSGHSKDKLSKILTIDNKNDYQKLCSNSITN